MDNKNTIENIVFDMGGVLFDLNSKRCIKAFEAIGAVNTAQYVREFRTEDLFHLIETTNNSTEEFCKEVRRIDNINASDEEIIFAWNELLETTPDCKRDALLDLKEKGYRLFLLSNTNDMHWQKASRQLIPYSGHDISEYFEKAFLSYKMGMRKPAHCIFQQVIDETGIRPENTLFVDDNINNVNSAAELGIQTFHETDGHRWIEQLNDLLK